MGIVYRGYDTKLGREVAIKTIQFDRQTSGTDASRIERFQVEADALARLAHPNIVSGVRWCDANCGGRALIVC